jgi:alkanesulfonate monooxygenase SsuD/methylene tetrahydromethanopterin reductase-like flavin-dependent oxidoreductase (luciferase family)
MSGLHVGVTPWLPDREGSGQTLASQGEIAEELGLQSFWLPESHFVGARPMPAPLLQLAAVAARTTRLRLATTSYLLPHRNPIQAAEEVAVLDQLSGGRTILGVGRGFQSALFAAFDVPIRDKRDRFEAALRVMRCAWAGEPVGIDPGAEGAESASIHVSPLPVQKPHPPIWVAAFGPKALKQAGRLALPYLASPMEPIDRLEENYALHREACPEDARDLDVPIMRTVFITCDRELAGRVRQALQQQTALLARSNAVRLRRVADSALEDWALVGEPAAVADAVAFYRERLGMTHLIVRPGISSIPSAETQKSLELIAELSAH